MAIETEVDLSKRLTEAELEALHICADVVVEGYVCGDRESVWTEELRVTAVPLFDPPVAFVGYADQFEVDMTDELEHLVEEDLIEQAYRDAEDYCDGD